MKSLVNHCDQPSGIPLVADDLLEYHAARILLLLKYCGKKGRIEGLTKFAKLDFFVRYPSFFSEATSNTSIKNAVVVESSMVRHHYGPWDFRYYHLLSYLTSREVLEISKHNTRYDVKLTIKGEVLAQLLSESGEFVELLEHMKVVKKSLGNFTGSKLKCLIYETFDKEIVQLPLGAQIR